MPPVSQAQRRYFYWADAHPKESGVSHKVANDFEGHGIKGLPERVHKGKPVKKATGGIAAYGLAKGGSVKVYHAGNSGEDVRNIQTMLAAAGFDPGRADASFGRNTERAVREFQAAHGLTVDGRVGRETMGALKALSVPNPRPRPQGLGALNDTSSGPEVAFGAGSGFSAPRPRGAPPGPAPGLGGAEVVSKPAPNVTIMTKTDHAGEHETDPVINHMATSNRNFADEQSKNERMFQLEQRLRQGPMPLDDKGFDFARGGTKGESHGLAQMGQQPKDQGKDHIDMNQATPFKSGLIKSNVPGRTDRLPLVVDKNAFVWPADLVSGLGQGNSDAGAQILGQLMAQYEGINDGTDGNGPNDAPVPIVAAGGEFITDPSTVMAVGGGDMNKGHKLLKNAVVSLRKQIAKHMLSLPGPK